MASDFFIRQNDTLPSLQATLKGPDDEIVNLTGAAVRFHMRLKGNPVSKVATAAVVVNAGEGIVRYDWVPADTDTPGDYFGEFQVTWGSSIESFPNNEYIDIKIVPQAG